MLCSVSSVWGKGALFSINLRACRVYFSGNNTLMPLQAIAPSTLISYLSEATRCGPKTEVLVQMLFSDIVKKVLGAKPIFEDICE